METFNQANNSDGGRVLETCYPVVDEEWERMYAQIPFDLDNLAQETKALQRKREVKSGVNYQL